MAQSNKGNKMRLKIITALVILACVSNIEAKKQPEIEKIRQAAYKDSLAWERMAEVCDTYGPRLPGSENLNDALDWLERLLEKDNFSKIQRDTVITEKWVRGEAYCNLIEPYSSPIPCLTLGGSVATPQNGITAEVIAIGSKEELEEKADEIKGKIVMFDEPFVDYGHNVQYRVHAADWASKYGALATMIRPTTPKSYQNPHTGVMKYGDTTVAKIPHFSVTDEAASLMRRLYDRGQKIVVRLYSSSYDDGQCETYNLMGEMQGTTLPDDIIAVGGHVDSWDAGIGSGAHDDIGPCLVGYHAIKLLRDLGLKTKRTLRVVFWVDEEYRQMGGKKYAELHGKENHFALLEYDSGIFPPTGVNIQASDEIYQQIKSHEKKFQKMSEGFEVHKSGWAGVDIAPMQKLGYTAMGWRSYHEDYFIYHHSPLDVPEAVDPKIMNENIAVMAYYLYILGNL
jgi:carboxypeptidase Q